MLVLFTMRFCILWGRTQLYSQRRLCHHSMCCRDYDGRTALHIAAARGSLKVIDYLLSCRADANAVDMCARLGTSSRPAHARRVVHPAVGSVSRSACAGALVLVHF